MSFTKTEKQFIVALVVLAAAVLVGFFWRHAHTGVASAQKQKQSVEIVTEAEPVPRRVLGEHTTPIRPAVPAHGLLANILMYHHVGTLPGGADATRRDLTVSTEDFAAQVAWLSQNGYTSVTLAQVDAATRKLYVMPKKPVVFTFDDGYADVFENAVPILQKYSMVGSFAVVPGFLGTPDYATWSQVEAAKQSGMEIVSHTENHFDGSSAKFDAAYIKSNLEQSLRELDAHLGTVPRVLVYPYGHSSAAYVEVAKEVGFTMALTTRFGHYVDLDDPMHTARVRVHGGETLERFVEILTGNKNVASRVP